MKVAIIGSGYVGLTTAAVVSHCKHEVCCIDIDSSKVNTINSGKSHFYEPGLSELIQPAIVSGMLSATEDYKSGLHGVSVALVCVGTPQTDTGEVDLSYIYEACTKVAETIATDHEIELVIKSTVPPGTAAMVEAKLSHYGKMVKVISSPEFLAEGSAVKNTLFSDRNIVGTKNASADDARLLISLYKDIENNRNEIIKLLPHNKYASPYRNNITTADSKLFILDRESAELVKVSSNAFLATKISFANMVARVCEIVGADVNLVMDAVGADKRIGRDFLYAGLGWGGGCFPKDVIGLISLGKTLGADVSIIEAAYELNFSQVNYLLEMVRKKFGSLLKQKVAVWGLAFKPGTSDLRVSPALNLCKLLVNEGALVTAYDPAADSEAREYFRNNSIDVTIADSAIAAANKSDMIILATDWPEFTEIDFKNLKTLMRHPRIVDARNRLDPGKMRQIGYAYIGIGRK